MVEIVFGTRTVKFEILQVTDVVKKEEAADLCRIIE